LRTEPPAWVLDTSVAVKLIHPEPLAERADTLVSRLDAPEPATAYIPDLFFVECANVIWKHARRLHEPKEVAARDLIRLENLHLISVATRELVDDALQIALLSGATAHDSCYVALGARLSIPLITADENLVRRFSRTAHEVLWLGDPALGLASS
jgi:predicted nucleic acid-binding protein